MSEKLVYVGCGGLAIIDQDQKKVIDYPFIPHGASDIAVSPDGSRLYSTGGNALDVFDLKAKKTITTIEMPYNENYLCVIPNGLFVYIGSFDGETSSSAILVMDTTLNKITKTLRNERRGYLSGITARPDGKSVYLVDGGDGAVLEIDTSLNKITGGYAVINTPLDVAFTPDSKFAYTSAVTTDKVWVVDNFSGKAKTIPGFNGPNGLASTPDGKYMYVANAGSNNVSIIDTASNEIIVTTTVGNNPSPVAVSPDGLYAYVGNGKDKTVSMIDTKTHLVVATIPVKGRPASISTAKNW